MRKNLREKIESNYLLLRLQQLTTSLSSIDWIRCISSSPFWIQCRWFLRHNSASTSTPQQHVSFLSSSFVFVWIAQVRLANWRHILCSTMRDNNHFSLIINCIKQASRQNRISKFIYFYILRFRAFLITNL